MIWKRWMNSLFFLSFVRPEDQLELGGILVTSEIQLNGLFTNEQLDRPPC